MLQLKVFDPDYIEPNFAWMWIVILWTVLIFIVLITLRLNKVRRDRERIMKAKAARRETYIEMKNREDEDYLEKLRRQGPQPTGRR